MVQLISFRTMILIFYKLVKLRFLVIQKIQLMQTILIWFGEVALKITTNLWIRRKSHRVTQKMNSLSILMLEIVQVKGHKPRIVPSLMKAIEQFLLIPVRIRMSYQMDFQINLRVRLEVLKIICKWLMMKMSGIKP